MLPRYYDIILDSNDIQAVQELEAKEMEGFLIDL